MTSILYVASDEGVVVLKSEDRRSWRLAHRGLEDWSVQEVAVWPSAPNKLFAATRGDGVWLSEDFGATWTKPCYGKHGPGKVRCLTIDPRDCNTLYAGAEPIDVFVSRDGGRNWGRLDSIRRVPWVKTVTYPVATVEPHVRDIAVDPHDAKTLYVALQVGYMLKTTDGGESWRLLDNNLDSDVHTIAIHPRHSNNIFVATGGHDCRKGRAPGKALYCSRDGGATWSPMAADFTWEYSVPLLLQPDNPDVLYAAVANGQPGQWRRRPSGAEAYVIRSKDGGRNWQQLDGELAKASRDFVEALVFDEASGVLYAAQRSGDLFGSDDGGETWYKFDIKAPPLFDMKAVHA